MLPSCLLLALLLLSVAGAAEVSRARLAFGVMTYQKEGYTPEQTFSEFQRLMEHIYTSERHVYVFHVDVKSSAELMALIRGYCPASARNCLFIEPRNVAWGGLSTGEMMLALMQDAVESDIPWDHFVLIGHESVPLTSLEYAEAHIASFPLETNFIHCMDVGGYDFFGQWENARGRLEQVVVESYDPRGNKLLEDSKMQRQVPWADELTFYKSIQLVVLSRDFIRYLCYGRHTRRIMLYLANVKTSDEMLIPTLLQMNKTLAATATCDTTLHFTHWIRPGGSWHPEYLGLENLPQLLNTSELFARKFRAGTSDVLVEALGRIRDEALSEYRGLSEHLLYRAEEVNAMGWLVPLIRSHVQRARVELPEVPNRKADENVNLRAVLDAELRAMGLGGAEGGGAEEGQAVTTVTAQDHLFALDRVRRARDFIETEKFLGYIRWKRQRMKEDKEREQKEKSREKKNPKKEL